MLSYLICKKVAYADTSHRIEAILPYAIRKGRKHSVRFVKGKQVLRTNSKGWTWFVGFGGDARKAENLIKKQQIFMSSGIYRYWEGLYGRFGRVKLFQNYDKKGRIHHPDRDKGLGTDSKIVSAMVILGVGCCVGSVALLIEIFYFMYSVLLF